MRRMITLLVAVGMTAGILAGCAKSTTAPPPAKKATTAAPVTK